RAASRGKQPLTARKQPLTAGAQRLLRIGPRSLANPCVTSRLSLARAAACRAKEHACKRILAALPEVQRVEVVVPCLVILVTAYGYLMAALSLFSARTRNVVDDESDELFFVLLVPALNEEQVIARTLSSLLALDGNFLALVIDDASDDGTVAAITP